MSTLGRPPKPVMDRLMPRVVVDANGCWIWTGAIVDSGYGHIAVQGKNRAVHRVTYEHLVGPIPSGMQLDHLCRVRHCCNPKHLEPVTPQVNTLRGQTRAAANAAKTHCPEGHPYDSVNTARTKTGGRACRACRTKVGRRIRQQANAA